MAVDTEESSPGVSTKTNRWLQHAANLGVASPIVFATTVIVTASLRPEYSHFTSFISELGETGAPYAWVMNWFGFALMAAGVFVFSVLFALSKMSLSVRIGAGMVAVFAIGLFGAGWYSCDAGCTPSNPSFNQVMHDLSSLCLVWLSLVCLYFACLRWSCWAFAVYSLATGVLFIVTAAIMVDSIPDRSGTGLYQRLGIGLLWVWIIVLAMKLKKHALTASHSS